jgi:uncharacterized protein
VDSFNRSGIACPANGVGMLYAVICTDKPNSLAIRKAKRPEHLEYLDSLGDTLVLAGPFTEADGETMNGSLIVIEAASLQAAKSIAAGDPFAKVACSPRSRSARGSGCSTSRGTKTSELRMN